MKNIFFTCWLIGLGMFISSCNGQKSYDTSFDESFGNELNDNKVQGVSFAVFNADSVIWSGNSGNSDSLKTRPVSLNTRFNIGSVTKLFTALAIMQLHEKGLLDIDKPVRFYIPEFSIEQRFPESQPITIRSVLTHHSGLPCDYLKGKFSEKPGDYQVILTYLNEQSTCFPVGKVMSYSNLGYALLGIVIERVSGLSYTSYINKYIFEPVKMTGSGFYQQYGQDPSLSTGFNDEGRAQKELPLLDIPAGSIYSTVADMVKFGQALFLPDSSLITRKTLDMMLEVQNMDVALDMRERVGLCWSVSDKAKALGRVYQHGGATTYHRAQFFFAPDAGLGAVVLSNSANGVKNAWRINEEMMVNFVKENKVSVKENYLPEKIVPLTPARSKDLRSFTGWYATYGMVCRFDLKNDNLYTTIQGNSFYLVPYGENDFVPAKRFMGIMAKRAKSWFHFESAGDEKLLLESTPWGALNIVGQQFKPQSLTSEWLSRTGKYIVEKHENNIIESMEITNTDGILVMHFQLSKAWNSQKTEAALAPVDMHRAVISGLGRNAGEMLKFEDNGFEFGGLKFTKI